MTTLYLKGQHTPSASLKTLFSLFMEGYHNFTVYFNNIIKTFLIWVLKYHYHIPHEEYYSVNLHKLTSMAKVTLD